MISLSSIRTYFLFWILGSIIVSLFKGKVELHTIFGWIDIFAFIVMLHIFDWLDNKK